MTEQTIITSTTTSFDFNTQHTQLWNIITINTRGLQDTCKRELWFNFLALQSYHIIVHTETNSKTHDTLTWKIPNFKSWWHNCDSQTIGQGIGISLANNLADRVFKTQTWAGRIISLDLSFPHKRFLRIIALYYPASTQTGKYTISNIVKKLITEATQKQWHIITIGDFNAVTNPQIDKSQTNRATLHHTQPTSDIIKFLVHNQHIDTFRELHPYSKKFTWNNTRMHHSRIDQIWINSSQHWLLLQADIQEIDHNILDTDHKAAICTIEAWDLIQGTQAPRIKQPNNRFDWNQTSNEQWAAFDKQILQQLNNQYPTDSTSNNISINHKWNIIRDIILKAAAKNIKKFKENRRRSKPTYSQTSHILTLAKLIRISKLCINDKSINNHINLVTNLHSQLSHKFVTPPLSPIMTNTRKTDLSLLQQWHSELTTYLTAVKLSWKKLLHEKQKTQINQYIQR